CAQAVSIPAPTLRPDIDHLPPAGYASLNSHLSQLLKYYGSFEFNKDSFWIFSLICCICVP
ncbi:MAG: hypothetical protein N0E48_14460, partial [Candidatus Thiodiazotropha endolucinida]|nr:hypothetical protein [Candidatus Thiodiazotropha taylori]MCW4344536.1 hypothetical protein [Candidatus Thiodiazotropha endolucinida]